MSKTKTLNIHNIRIDGDTQARVSINQEVVEEYAESIKNGAYLPEVTVFFDGAEYWLADGFHRFHAHLKAGKAAIIVEWQKGTQRDAILYSLGANCIHGLRPSNEDKRKAVSTMLADPEWVELSDRDIAKHCGVSHTFVAMVRNPKKDETAATKAKPPAPASGNVATTKTEPTGNVATPATAKNAQAEQNAEDAHGGEDDPIALLEASNAENAELRNLLAVAEADDKVAETVKWKRISDVAQRRQQELMDTVNEREKELKRQANILRRISAAVGEEDYSKLAAIVEAMARAAKAVK